MTKPDFTVAGSLDTGWIRFDGGKREYYVKGRAVPSWYGWLAVLWLRLWLR